MDAIIQVEHLAKRYRTSVVPAVDDISFEVHPGELFAFLGPNGAGKTTTISILTTTLAKTRDRQHAHHRQPRVCPSSSVYLAATSRLLDLRPGGTGRVDHQS